MLVLEISFTQVNSLKVFDDLVKWKAALECKKISNYSAN